MTPQERSVLNSHLEKLKTARTDIGAVIARASGILENLPPGNKGGQAMNDQRAQLHRAGEYLNGAIINLESGLSYDVQY